MGRKKAKKRKNAGGDATGATPRSTPVVDAETQAEALGLQEQEVEVLQAIFDSDMTMHSSTPVYTYLFTIRLACETTGGRGAAEVLLHFDLSKGYPLVQPPNITVENQHGISKDEKKKLTSELETQAKSKIGDAVIYDLVVSATEFIQEHLKDQTSFFDQMVHRQHEIESAEKREQDELLEQQEQAELAKDQELLALIDAERRRKEEKVEENRRMKQTRQRRRRHRSSIDVDEESFSRGDGYDSYESDTQPSKIPENSGDTKDSEDSSEEADDLSLASNDAFRHSRYHSDFKELGILGRGGGGEVVKAQNRLDRQLYAVKKIKLDAEDPAMKKKLLREVKTISRMQHRHIVRYFQAWLEDESGLGSDSESEEEDESASSASRINQRKVSTDEEYEDDDWLGTMSKSNGLWQSSPSDDDWDEMEEAPEEYIQDQVLSKPSAVALGGQNRTLRRNERLYIQMEYCEGNALREVIDKSGLHAHPDKIWTLFRQILEAMTYIHRQGVIHRDIKPPNIFLDAEGAVKLGDFGLAVRPPKALDEEVNDETGVENAPVGFDSVGSTAAELYGKLKTLSLDSTRHNVPWSATSTSLGNGVDITAGVGTTLYRAPEQEREGQRYDQKADLYSLGIVFFEMWSPPFATQMERFNALMALRENHELPSTFDVPENVKALILWLCSRDPKDRPNAADVLRSNLLPAKMEVEQSYLQEALETLANPQGRFFSQFVDALLAHDPEAHAQYTYDHLEPKKQRTQLAELHTRAFVKGTLQKVLERHGATEHSTPLLLPRAPAQNLPKNAFTLLDRSGVAVALPFDLTERMARYVGRQNLSRWKGFEFSRVYRAHPAGGHPHEFLEAELAIVWNEKNQFRCVEIEALQVVAEVMDALSSYVGSYYLRVADARLTKAVLELCNVPIGSRREVLRLLARETASRVHHGTSSTSIPAIQKGAWRYITKRMQQHGVSECVMEALQPFFLLPEDPLSSLDHTESELKQLAAKHKENSDAGQKTAVHMRRMLKEANEAIASLRELLSMLDAVGLQGPTCLRLDIGLSPRPERYTSGLIFQAVLMPTSSKQSFKTQVIAEGGRYDSLVSSFRLPSKSIKASPVAAMSVRVSIDKICPWVVTTAETKPSNTVAPIGKQHTILVCSAGKGNELPRLRLQVAMILWSHSLDAEYLHPDALHLEDLETYCVAQQIRWMVVVQKHLLEKKQVKVRAVRNPSEPDVVVSCSTLAEFMAERLHLQNASADSSGNTFDATTSDNAPQPVFDVVVVDNKQHGKEGRGGNKNHQMDSQKITRRVSKWISASFSSKGEEAMKVVSVDLPFVLLRELSTALMESGATGVDDVCARNPRYRKQVRNTSDEILALQPQKGHVTRERYVLLHSLVDDRYDMMSLTQSNKDGGKR